MPLKSVTTVRSTHMIVVSVNSSAICFPLPFDAAIAPSSFCLLRNCLRLTGRASTLEICSTLDKESSIEDV